MINIEGEKGMSYIIQKVKIDFFLKKVCLHSYLFRIEKDISISIYLEK